MLRSFFVDRSAGARRLFAGSLILASVGTAAVWPQAPMVDITPPPGVVAISGGKVLTVSQGVIENGVVLIEGGKIIEDGNHRSLLRRGGHYCDLYTNQFTHEREEAVLGS